MSGHGLTIIPSFLKHATYTTRIPRRPYTRPSSQKLLSRGGRNLSERFQRLEETFRTKYDLDQQIFASRPLTPLPPATLPHLSTVTTFKGLVIPEVPKAPEPDGVSFTRFPGTALVLTTE